MTEIKIKCLFCNFETKLRVNDRDSRGYFEVPERYCNKCKTPMEQVVDGVAKKLEEDKKPNWKTV